LRAAGSLSVMGSAPARGRIRAVSYRLSPAHEENVLLPFEQDDHLRVPSPTLVVIADKEQSSRDEMRRKLSALPFAPIAAEVAELTDESAVLEVMRRKQPAVLLMAAGFLGAHHPKSIAERSFCTKLPMVATYPCDSATVTSLTSCLPSALEPSPLRTDRNSLEILRTWSEALDTASGLADDERAIVTRSNGRLG
jgi:hypothetical protein